MKSAAAFLLAGVLALGLGLGAGPATASDAVSVNVDRRGELVVIDVETTIPATPQEVWAVLTDYDGMASFVSSIKSSRVVSRRGDALEVAQSGETKVAFMRFAFTGVRGIDLVPGQEIRSRMIEGDFKSFQSTTRLVEVAGGTKLVHHGEYVPKKWLPPMIGPAVITSATRRHYGEVVAEVMRRGGASNAAPR